MLCESSCQPESEFCADCECKLLGNSDVDHFLEKEGDKLLGVNSDEDHFLKKEGERRASNLSGFGGGFMSDGS